MELAQQKSTLRRASFLPTELIIDDLKKSFFHTFLVHFQKKYKEPYENVFFQKLNHIKIIKRFGSLLLFKDTGEMIDF